MKKENVSLRCFLSPDYTKNNIKAIISYFKLNQEQ